MALSVHNEDVVAVDFFRLRRGLYILFVIGVIFSSGCEEPQSDEAELPPIVESPESQLDWAMERLQRALEEFRPPKSVGLRIKQKMTYEYLPPDGSRAYPAATVTIDTKTFYLPDAPNRADREQEETEEKPVVAPNLGLDEEENEFPALDAANIQLEDPLVRRTPVPTPKVESVKTYELHYIEDRWQLVSEVESESERSWFEYALSR